MNYDSKDVNFDSKTVIYDSKSVVAPYDSKSVNYDSKSVPYDGKAVPYDAKGLTYDGKAGNYEKYQQYPPPEAGEFNATAAYRYPGILGDREVTANIYRKSRNLPNTDTQNYSTDIR